MKKESLTINCRFCNRKMESPRSNKQFCNDTCRYHFWNELNAREKRQKEINETLKGLDDSQR